MTPISLTSIAHNPVGVRANCNWGDALTLHVAKAIYSVNILIHSVSPQKGYSATYVDGHDDRSRKTIHLAHFATEPQHFAAIGLRSPPNPQGDKYPFAERSAELTARIRDELDEMAATMCSSLFQQHRQTPALLHTEVMRAVTAELNDGRGRELDRGDSCEVAMKYGNRMHAAPSPITYNEHAHTCTRNAQQNTTREDGSRSREAPTRMAARLALGSPHTPRRGERRIDQPQWVLIKQSSGPDAYAG